MNLEQLKKEGYEIEAVRNKGYRLVAYPDILNKSEISSLIRGKWAGKNLICYNEIDSTNNQAKAAGEQGMAHGTLFVADKQTSTGL